jgi:hypothetical protein
MMAAGATYTFGCKTGLSTQGTGKGPLYEMRDSASEAWNCENAYLRTENKRDWQ